MRFYWPIAKLDHERRMVWGYASTEAEDDQGEIIRRDALEAALDDYMRFANIREMHQPSAVGIAEEAAIDDRGLYLGARIVDGEAWEKVVAGVYKGFSIGGHVTARDPADRKVITGLSLTEISVVDRPANPEAVFDCWKRAAAADDTSLVHPIVGRTKSAEPGNDVEYADSGYQEDGQQRYPIDTEAHIRAAWAYIHQPGNALHYTAHQLADIKTRIAAAWRDKIDPAGPPAANGESTIRTAGVSPAPSKLAGRPEAGAPGRLRALLAELCQLLESLSPNDDEALAALAIADSLRKSRVAESASFAAGLAKLADDIVPRLDALQRRVDDIARTPLPPLTAARGIAAIAKRDDGHSTFAAPDDIIAALAQMTDEERTLTLIKAARANPLRPTR